MKKKTPVMPLRKGQCLLPRDRAHALREMIRQLNGFLMLAKKDFGFRLDIEDDHLVMLSDDALPEGYEWVAMGDFTYRGTISMEVGTVIEDDFEYAPLPPEGGQAK